MAVKLTKQQILDAFWDVTENYRSGFVGADNLVKEYELLKGLFIKAQSDFDQAPLGETSSQEARSSFIADKTMLKASKSR